MCGRTACALAPDDVLRACNYRDGRGRRRCPAWVDAPGGQQYRTGYNLAPGTHTPVLVCSKALRDKALSASDLNSDVERIVMPMKWGLTPVWHTGDPYKIPYETNNCRAEGMLEKKTFKIPLQRGNRCVILADGFFEWKTGKDGKQPFYFYFPGEQQKPACTMNKQEEKSAVKLEELSPIMSECWDMSHAASRTELGLTEPQGSRYGNLISHETKVKVEPAQKDFNENRNFMGGNGKLQDLGSLLVKQEPDTQLWTHVQDYHNNVEGKHQKKVEEGDGDTAVWEGPRLLTMAGVFDIWRSDQNAQPLFSYSIITVAASSDMDWCHHRMPAILSNETEVNMWLDASTIPLNKAVSLIKPKVCLAHHAVSKQVNNSRYQAPDCVKPVELGSQQIKQSPGSKLMQKWLQSASPGKRKLPGSPGQDGNSQSKRPSVCTSSKKSGAENLMMKWLQSGSPTKKS